MSASLYTSNPDAMRAIHAYCGSEFRNTNVQVLHKGTDWMFGVRSILIQAPTDESKWIVQDAWGKRITVKASQVRMAQSRW